ncbi:MAG: sulfite dehydrogenase [Sulfuricurvum sp.]|nr:sulfite dehydrogenase [Sulfuricurvum sp.]MDP3023876.1 sulfite dehydrogenase [Sulfuricurvum sp.]MDP3119249.1 sulfite dehydrogenase [Sulfuricurvum sp.]
MSNNDSLSNDKKLDRRDFFRKTAALSATALAGTSIFADDDAIMKTPEWATKWGDPVTTNLYGIPSAYEHNVTRRSTELLSSGNFRASIAVTPIHESKGIITPNGLFFSRSHGGTAHIDPEEYRLMIHGLVEKPIVLTLAQLKRYPSVTRIHFIECPANGGQEWRATQFNSVQFAKGFMASAEWTGVYIKTILDDLGIKPEAQWMLAEGGDSSKMGRTVPMDKVLDDAMIVWGQNGEALRPEQGYPVRLLLPGWEGNLCVKWLRRLEFAAEPWYCKEETSKYTALKPSGKAIQHFYANEVNSTVVSPSPEIPWTDLPDGAVVEIEGLAWSGMGTITGVDFSLDGGRTYVQAELKGLVLPKSWTRWSYMHTYKKGDKLLLTSRAMDDAGFIQPTIDEETSVMGVESVYHRNAVETWEVTENGEVNHVQIRS